MDALAGGVICSAGVVCVLFSLYVCIYQYNLGLDCGLLKWCAGLNRTYEEHANGLIVILVNIAPLDTNKLKYWHYLNVLFTQDSFVPFGC